uniref:NADH dehydrogenase subunit 2 n=1 Tax=Atkinsoniella nigrita TaxID=2937673 RepID=UPI00208E435A|nr:NADH dehydrogenase subunit 2 [Atkinsoniella nigrita]USC52161.1 NADH dehydrogenase subunit 2 [Atkinsoniella nigrita]
MSLNLTKLLYYTTMIIGVMVCICSNNWMMIWAGLEISLMSFLPLMTSNSMLSSESMMKYFIIQGMSSALMMFGVMFMLIDFFYSNYILTMSLMLKIGISPFHNWVLSVIDGLNYECVFFLLTFMKISPLMIMSYINVMLWIPILISLVVGATLGINQNSMRKMLGYSSIYNLGFICSCISEISLWIIYMLIYSFMLMSMIFMISKLNVSYFNQVMMNEFDLKIKLSFWLMMLSFGGIPPMLGFLNKLMLFEFMIYSNQMLVLFFMIISSLIVMFYYIRSTFMSIMISSMIMKWNLFSLNYSVIYTATINFMLMSLMIFVKSLT